MQYSKSSVIRFSLHVRLEEEGGISVCKGRSITNRHGEIIMSANGLCSNAVEPS